MWFLRIVLKLITISFRIRNECTVYISEHLCICFLVKCIISQDRQVFKYLTCTDCLFFNYCRVIVDIQLSRGKLRERSISVCVTFFREHVGMHGNEQTDRLAENATKKNINVHVNVPKSFLKNVFKFETIEKCSCEYITT